MTDRPYSVAQLAERWGCSRRYVHKVVASGKLPHFRIGKFVRIPADAVTAYDRIQEAATGKARDIAHRIMRTVRQFPPDGGFVYFIRCREIVKIGYSRNTEVRRQQLQQTIPFELTILGQIPGSMQAERALHAEFAGIKHGLLEEWFALSDELAAAIEAISEGSTRGEEQ